MGKFEKAEPFFDIIGEILAVFLVLVFIVSLADAKWQFLQNVPVLYNIFAIARTYGSILLMAVVGCEAMCKRNMILFFVYLGLLAIIVIFLFFPETYENLIGLIDSTVSK